MFQNEFCWTYLSRGEGTRSLSGVDVQNVGLYDIKGVVKDFLGAISKISQEHYPERAGRICILNTPSWFSMLWSVIKLMLHPNTQKKVFILSRKDFINTLQKLINKEDIPVEYGGSCDFLEMRERLGADAVPTTAEDFYGHLPKNQEAGRYAVPPRGAQRRILLLVSRSTQCIANPLLQQQQKTNRYCSELEVAMADYIRRLNAGLPLPLPSSQSWGREVSLALLALEQRWRNHG